ncbi:hypothetical protein HPB49_005060 [Dermacentor silvarum]|uniref:Uncharacterized protein n=1 Tax=Dermacentor silvarum TaxID=543639 RepID=A0ACB8C265_DERSI|nr:hypothetical protein HPB49_005060 [Dermacentor silvarum]
MNPGPEKSEQVIALVKELTLSDEKFQKETSSKLKDIQTNVAEIKRRLSKLEDKLQAVANLRQDVTSVNATLQESHAQLKSIESKQSQQANIVVDDLNHRMRRNNLIFKGIPEQQTEKWTDTEKLIGDIVAKNLGVQAGEIERAHRIGQKKSGYDRPIIAKFRSFKDKTNILKNAFKLNDLESPRVWIEEDFSPRI